jgi:hypothetical protein
MLLRPVIAVVIGALVATQSGPVRSGPLRPDVRRTGIAAKACEDRVNDTVAKLEACIQQGSLWRRLARFQRIAENNPGPEGHPNRDTGTPGYRASVAYVAGLVQHAGYNVTIQQYTYRNSIVEGFPTFRAGRRSYVMGRDWLVARGSAGGAVSAAVEPPSRSSGGCASSDFAAFHRGNVALVERGHCALDTEVANARAAGAVAVVLYEHPPAPGAEPADGAQEARLIDPVDVPVIGMTPYDVGAGLLRQYRSGSAPTAQIDVAIGHKSDLDYNLIADSPYGDPSKTVVLDAHLDSIYGEGMLDNASGSTTILEIALNLAKTPTRNRLRYIWFGGEELGLLGSHYYTQHLSPAERKSIAFDVDADVTATPNFDILVADPQQAHNVAKFPPNVVPQSKIGNDEYARYFNKAGVVWRDAWFGNDGTDSNAFSLIGVPNTGILTQQDCCKRRWERKLWGGFLGNYEGEVPGRNGGCVDQPHRWCDNLSNNDPFVFELASKATAYVAFKLANRRLP